MADYQYTMPEFLKVQSADKIHARMLELLPDDIDKAENTIPWDFTRPTALEIAQMSQQTLNEVIKIIFAKWSYGEWLDLHGQQENCIRRPPNKATGTLNITGTPGTVIPLGYRFATPANLTASILFETVEEYTLTGEPDDKGLVTNTVEIRAVEGGLSGNVAADSIKLMVNPIASITFITNPEALTGGTDAESDNEYRERILDSMQNGLSRTGCNSDYVAWAKEVSAVGQVIVDPEWNDPELPEQFHYIDKDGNERCAGAVRLLIIDSNGEPANQQILNDVYTHIAGTDDTDPERLMPIGAHLTVQAPTNLVIDISANVLLEDGENIDTIISRFKTGLNEYWLESAQEAANNTSTHSSVIYWVQIGAILAKTEGVLDYTDLLVNGTDNNITITHEQYPLTGEVVLNVEN